MLRGNKKTSQQCMQTTPVGFEPMQGDPIGLAGRRLSHSAKVSLSEPIRVSVKPTVSAQIENAKSCWVLLKDDDAMHVELRQAACGFGKF